MWGGTAAFRVATGLVRQPYFAEMLEAEQEWTEARLGGREFNHVTVEGAAMSLEQTLEQVEHFPGADFSTRQLHFFGVPQRRIPEIDGCAGKYGKRVPVSKSCRAFWQLKNSWCEKHDIPPLR
ncbi:hypothetical protein ACFOPQ_01675 [Deinococcus antarcticus]|uniref:Uncharacterized protein n=1 Tax=Deinococcus antarcticus TaxID=1298767 RepID=A0ABV8A1F4_9DEIO